MTERLGVTPIAVRELGQTSRQPAPLRDHQCREPGYHRQKSPDAANPARQAGQPMNHEEALHQFVVPEKQARYIQYIGTTKHRKKLIARLNHNHDFDARFLLQLPPHQQTDSVIYSLLKTRGAPEDCHVISTNETLDGHRMPLRDALARIVSMGHGTVMSCIPGKLAYYEGEDSGERYLLSRP